MVVIAFSSKIDPRRLLPGEEQPHIASNNRAKNSKEGDDLSVRDQLPHEVASRESR
jgi:hypothetical protein